MAFPRRTSSWFSTEKPNCESDTVWSSVVPPLWFLRDLESALPQAWLNGVQSVVDPNNPNHRLPLWSIRFYREVTDLHDAQEKWLQSKYWLPNAEHFILDRVGWNSVRDGAFDGQLGWARVIDDEWLSGDNIDNIMQHIKACASEDPAIKSSTTIAFLSFQREITKFATNPPTNPSRILARYAAEMRAGKSILYNPVHLNENHWIAFKTDFAKRQFGYGHSTQTDGIHCGIYTGNTLEHALFGTPILKLSDCGAARLRWFKIFLDRANAGFSAADVIEMQEQSFTDVVAPPTSSGICAPMSLFNILNPVVQQTTSEPVSPIVPAVAISEDSDVVQIPGPAITAALPLPKTDDPGVAAPTLKRKLAAVHRSDDSDADEYNSEDAKRTARRKPPKKSSKDVKSRAKKTTAAECLAQLKADPNIIKLSDGSLKGSSSVVYCKCKPHFALSLEGEYLLKNWTSHKQSCELCKLVKPGARTRIIPPAVKKYSIVAQPPGTGIASFFTVKPAAGAGKPPVTKSLTSAVTKRAVIVGDQRLDPAYFKYPLGTTFASRKVGIVLPRTELDEPAECLGLHGEGYQEYAWQHGDTLIGGVSATAWIRLSRCLFIYKAWSGSDNSSNSDDSDPGHDEIPQKAVREACAL
ncbi:hypothetical protein GGX14DRAFT_565883 [Mycena pura]|uniref:Ubiquitin-like protease family profile domain-containing protein n=1 Tax=Mycena pura TaxID=153505 RepID=A0AAD6YHD3_9AGAR|nr:hypothetical protein GGX14DRAFT_565883 [Mycena pura]